MKVVGERYGGLALASDQLMRKVNAVDLILIAAKNETNKSCHDPSIGSRGHIFQIKKVFWYGFCGVISLIAI